MLRLFVPVVLLALAIPAAAQAAKVWKAYGLYDGSVAVEDGSGTHTARMTQMLLPSTFDVEKRGDYLAFGPVGLPQHRLDQGRARRVDGHHSRGRARRAAPDGTSYGSGTNRDAAWKIVNTGGGKLRGAYVRPTQIDDTWVVVRVATTPHATCHTGGYRESVAYPLADALAATKASGF